MSITVMKIRGVTVPAPEWMGGRPIDQIEPEKEPGPGFNERNENIQKRLELRRSRVKRLVEKGLTKREIIATCSDMTFNTLDNDLRFLGVSCRRAKDAYRGLT